MEELWLWRKRRGRGSEPCEKVRVEGRELRLWVFLVYRGVERDKIRV